MATPFLLLDVDNTLYPRSAGVVDQIDARINRYLRERLRLPEDDVDHVRSSLWSEFGTTLFGLLHRHGIAPSERGAFAADYSEFVHDIDHETLLAPDPALATMLAEIPLQKVAMTNGSGRHATTVLECLGVRSLFFRILALEHFDWIPKPYVHAFQAVLAVLHTHGADCIFVDDTPANLPPARRLGMRTIHLADGTPPAEEADVVITSIHQLPAALAALGVPGLA